MKSIMNLLGSRPGKDKSLESKGQWLLAALRLMIRIENNKKITKRNLRKAINEVESELFPTLALVDKA